MGRVAAAVVTFAVMVGFAAAGCGGSSEDPAGGSSTTTAVEELQPVRFECPDRDSARDLLGDFADLINDGGLQERLSLASLENQVQIVANDDAQEPLLIARLDEIESMAAARGCPSF